MTQNDVAAFALLIGYFVAAGLPAILFKVFGNAPFEVIRKMYHFVFILSIIPLLVLFSTWYTAALAALTLSAIVYVLLALFENTAFFGRMAVEREGGEFKRSFLLAQLTMVLLIVIFWGLLGADWKFVAFVAVMAWGFGDAAAALVGKSLGRNHIRHPAIEGAKTVEGSLAMVVVAGIAILVSLLMVGQPVATSVILAVLVAPISAAVELFSRHGTDTVTVPLSVGFSVLLLLSLLVMVTV